MYYLIFIVLMAFACPNHNKPGHHNTHGVTTMDDDGSDDTGGETGHIPNHPPTTPPPTNP